MYDENVELIKTTILWTFACLVTAMFLAAISFIFGGGDDRDSDDNSDDYGP